MANLTLRVKTEYFHAIASGEKIYENRLITEYWTKRLRGRHYDNVIITLGYPKRDDATRRLVFPWRGYIEREIQHKHFGPEPVKVYSILLKA